MRGQPLGEERAAGHHVHQPRQRRRLCPARRGSWRGAGCCAATQAICGSPAAAGSPARWPATAPASPVGAREASGRSRWASAKSRNAASMASASSNPAADSAATSPPFGSALCDRSPATAGCCSRCESRAANSCWTRSRCRDNSPAIPPSRHGRGRVQAAIAPTAIPAARGSAHRAASATSSDPPRRR